MTPYRLCYHFFGKKRGFVAAALALFIASGIRVVAEDAAETPPPTRVLVVTGEDIACHPWRMQGIAIRTVLAESDSIDVRLVEDIEILGTDLIFDYDVLVLNFKNSTPLRHDQEAKENLTRFIRRGGGIVYFHFTGGAFEDWPEFESIAGRIWNPSFRAHDPYGPFTVRVVSPDHPIMSGLHDFVITDELYTCLDGTKPIEILAEAKSSVDGVIYPMAFVFGEGAGRGFHLVIGHDAEAFVPTETGRILRQAVLWTAKKNQSEEVTVP